MRKAAHLMVGSRAGSLALVTCRDPLRTSLTNRLRSLLAQGLDAAALEQYVQVLPVLLLIPEICALMTSRPALQGLGSRQTNLLLVRLLHMMASDF